MSPRPRQISDEEILEGACACFLKNGPGVSTQVIAEHLGISQAALFKRFNTKEELMISALLPPLTLPAFQWLKRKPDTADFRTQLEGLIRALWESLEIVFPRISALAMSGIPYHQLQARMKKLPLLTLLEEVGAWLKAAQAAGQIRKDEDPIILAQACMGALQGRAALRFVLRSQFEKYADERYLAYADDEQFFRSVADLLWRGMSEA